MKITKVNASYGFTVNIGNYESVKLQVGMEADVEEGDEHYRVLGLLTAECKDNIIDQVLEIRKAYGSR